MIILKMRKFGKRIKKNPASQRLGSPMDKNPLLLGGSINGAGIGASTARNALIGIDHIGSIALGDSADGALALASTALDASIANHICHGVIPPIKLMGCKQQLQLRVL